MNTELNAQTTYRDRGTALLLTIAFVVMIGAIAAGLAGLVTSGLNNTVTLQGLRDRQYAAEGAIENAITVVRDRIDKTADKCVAYEGEPLDGFLLNDVTIRVDWSVACGVVKGEGGLIFLQRNVVFTAWTSCLDGDKPCAPTRIVRAQVNFDQGNNGPVRKTVIQSWSVDS